MDTAVNLKHNELNTTHVKDLRSGHILHRFMCKFHGDQKNMERKVLELDS